MAAKFPPEGDCHPDQQPGNQGHRRSQGERWSATSRRDRRCRVGRRGPLRVRRAAARWDSAHTEQGDGTRPGRPAAAAGEAPEAGPATGFEPHDVVDLVTRLVRYQAIDGPEGHRPMNPPPAILAGVAGEVLFDGRSHPQAGQAPTSDTSSRFSRSTTSSPSGPSRAGVSTPGLHGYPATGRGGDAGHPAGTGHEGSRRGDLGFVLAASSYAMEVGWPAWEERRGCPEVRGI
jgi:hypothetical protein